MSKEMTPIEELIEDLEIISFMPDNYPISSIIDMVQREYLYKESDFIKTKVLEALEREFSKVLVVKDNGMNMTGKEYYETEVKPKYK